jgi:hypothetical protein
MKIFIRIPEIINRYSVMPIEFNVKMKNKNTRMLMATILMIPVL